ncbi:hypothetical protein L573_2681, partial [Bordetella holmesii H620]
LKNQGSSVTAIKHGSTLFRDEPFFWAHSASGVSKTPMKKRLTGNIT